MCIRGVFFPFKFPFGGGFFGGVFVQLRPKNFIFEPISDFKRTFPKQIFVPKCFGSRIFVAYSLFKSLELLLIILISRNWIRESDIRDRTPSAMIFSGSLNLEIKSCSSSKFSCESD